MSEADKLIRRLRKELAALSDAEKAPQMQAYMKSTMPYRGAPKPERAKLALNLFREYVLPDKQSWVSTILTLWREAEFREERYLAIDLSGFRAYANWQAPDLLPVYEELIVTGAWWDYVDEIAIRRVGPLLRSHPLEVEPVLRSWATDDDKWRQRTAVICQVGSKDQTDQALLTMAIESTMHDRDFFLRKGIGWALREYSKTEPEWVVDFVDQHPDLSPLSQREATRRINR